MKTEIKYNWNILTHYDAVQKIKSGKMPAPRFCTFQTSNICNQHCRGCSFGGHTEAKLDGRSMCREDHFDIVDTLIANGVRAFEFAGGGEPTLLEYLPELMYHLHKKNCSIGLITNGVKLTDEIITLLIDYGTYCRISLEAPTKEDYIKYKQVPEQHWNRVIENLRKLTKAKRIAKSLCDISIKFDVGKSLKGCSHFINAIELGKKCKVDSVQFKFFRHEPEELTTKDKLDEYFELKRILKDPDIIRNLKNINIINSLIPYRSLDDVPQCWLSPIHTVVDYLGDVYICCYYYYRMKEMKLGNMFTTTFYKLWYSQEHWDKIKSINKKECAKVDCKFFAHHQKVEEAFINGRQDFL